MRIATRSFAERARGLVFNSSSSGPMALRDLMVNWAGSFVNFGGKAVGVAALSGTRGEEAFDHAVLDRMKRHNGQLATGLQARVQRP